MKQVLQHGRTGEITVEEVPAPRVLPGCVLVRIAASVVSAGTERASAEFARKSLLQKAHSRPDLVREVISKIQRDGIVSTLQAVRGRLDQPQSCGYSSAGTVVATGDGVSDLRPGDRVSCAGAGFAVHAELACVPRLLVAPIPLGDADARGEVPFVEAAFGTLGAVALHGIRTAEAKLGDRVAVIGLGLIGQLTVQLLKAAGCQVLGIDIDPWRAAFARDLGADAVATSPSAFRELCLETSGGVGADSVLITAETRSSDPVNLAGEIARDRAIVVAVGTVGLEIERKTYYEKELDFRISRSYGPGRYDATYEQKGRDYPIGYVRWTETRNLEAFLRLLADHKIEIARLITHRFPVDQARKAYDLIAGDLREPFLGVVIEYPDGNVIDGPTLVLVERTRSDMERARVARVSVGVLGAGMFATGTLMPVLKASRETTLLGVCAANGSHAQHAARKFGFSVCTTDESELINNPDVNTVVIATRHHLHARQVVAALAAGKNVFCEKPLCLSEDELRSITSAYFGNARRLMLMVGFNRRFAPMIASMKSFLKPISEPLSMHYRINAGYLPPDHWLNDREHGGGRILGEMCHFVDLLAFLAGSQIVEVQGRAIGGTNRYSGGNVLASLFFSNGSAGTISYLANGDRAFSKERLEVFGGGVAAVLDDFRRLELVREGHTKIIRSRWRQDKGHAAEWAAFVESLQRDGEGAIPFAEIVSSTLATFRLDQSVATGKKLSLECAHFLDLAQRNSNLNPGLNA